MSPLKVLTELWRGKSTTRVLLNQAVDDMDLAFDGTVIDLGGTGSGTSSYRFIEFSPSTKIVSVNLDEGAKPTIKADLSKRFPIRKGFADVVLCFNTIHLVSDLDKFFSEAHRVLKPNGQMLINFPLIWPIHDEPKDYWRFTPHSARALLSKHLFTVRKIASYGGRTSSLISLFDEPIPKYIRPLFFFFAWIGDRISKKDTNCPIGILVYAQA